MREALALFDDGDAAIDLDAPKAVFVTSHRRSIERVVLNLLRNAVYYGQGRRIEVRVRAARSRVQLTVRDRGRGISPECLERLGEPYRSGDGAMQFERFGLGLWIVRRLAESIGAPVRVASQVGAGTAVTIALPRAAAR